MPHDQCPPSRRGHSWRELTVADLPSGSSDALRAAAALRICARCCTFGRVDSQGIVRIVEAAT
jgi:hypothetical protein